MFKVCCGVVVSCVDYIALYLNASSFIQPMWAIRRLTGGRGNKDSDFGGAVLTDDCRNR